MQKAEALVSERERVFGFGVEINVRQCRGYITGEE